MKHLCTAVLCCAWILSWGQVLAAGPDLGPGTCGSSCEQRFLGAGWSWDMSDYRLQQRPFWPADDRGAHAWPGEPLGHMAAPGDPGGPDGLALIAEDEVVGEPDGAAPLLRALERLTRPPVAWQQRFDETGRRFTVAWTTMAERVENFMARLTAPGPDPPDTIAAASQPARTSCQLPADPSPMSQPTVQRMVPQVPVGPAPMDVTETPGPVEYDPYRGMVDFDNRFARDEEQFRY